ncbi:NADPH-dependent F420 reductase [Paenibacillus anseongense]|uniref:NADPH-dependent F420 reductase n=1 Tax=Paenibacillus anseongense TaxID=2682845 RepID=UPI002DBFEBA0|nr:NAD(P)-binding domain-containing protein [Paenibacillus anseongense]MEC0268311.1 NAD(P)-binding domain-containing protein [Paenibacillus anseongense]
MKVSIIGTGRMGKALIEAAAPQIQNVIWGSRSIEKVDGLIKELGSEALPGSYDQALAADVIFHTLWFRDLLPWAKHNEEALKGKILVDICVPFTSDFSDLAIEWGTSAAEEIQQALPDTKVVGAFKNTFWKVFNQPVHQGVKSDVFVTSDDEGAKEMVMKLLQPLPFRFLDAGTLKNNRTIERMTLFSRELSQRYGHYPYVSWGLWGSDYKGLFSE